MLTTHPLLVPRLRKNWLIELVRNLMANAQKPHFVFRLNGRVHLNRWGSQFSRLLTAEVWASAVVMVDTPCCEVVWEYWLPTPFASFFFTSPPVRHRVPSHSESSIPPLTPWVLLGLLRSYLYLTIFFASNHKNSVFVCVPILSTATARKQN